MKKSIQLFLILAGSFFLVMFLIPIIFIGIINAGNLAGIFSSVVLILIGVYLNSVCKFFNKLCRKTFGKLLTAILCVIMCIFFGLAAYASHLLISMFSVPPTEDTVAIALGCKVNPTGPSRMLKARIDAAYDFLSRNPDIKCIVSGGRGPDEHISEAMCIYNELTAMGIDKERLYIEDKSTNTKENLTFSLDIIVENSLPHSVTIITNEFHQYRAGQIGADLGLKTYHVSGKTPFSMFPTYFLREVGGIIFEIIF